MDQFNQDLSEHDLFAKLIDENRYDFCKLVYIIFPFGQEGHDLENEAPRAWQMKEWAKLSKHLSNPETRYTTYRLAISTGNGSGKTAFAAMTNIMLMYTQKLRARLTANTKPQLTSVVWPEYDKWFKNARYSELWFEKLGESIRSLDSKLHDQWRLDMFTWDPSNPAAVSGLHNAGYATAYTFEEAPGIPANIFQYANGAFSDAGTIKVWLALGNSDDPDSKFESLMNNPDWNSLRIDTRTLENVDKAFIDAILRENNGDEDSDDFRVRVRGLPRKTSQDSIINREKVLEAFNRAKDFDIASVNHSPAILTIDPAWQGGDLTVIWFHQGHYSKLLEAYKLNKQTGEDHSKTYNLACMYEKLLRVDNVFIDQGEGTAIKTLANADGKYNWELVSFAQNPNDVPDVRNSDYANMRAQMYFMAKKEFNTGAPVLEIAKHIKIDLPPGVSLQDKVIKQFGYTKEDRHERSLKKLCSSKQKIKELYGESPDFSDGYVLKFYRTVWFRREENETAPLNQGYGGVMQKEEVKYDGPDYDMRKYMPRYR